MKVAVAGASGFVGRALTARLASDGHDVLALSRSSPDAVDVGDEDATARALEGCEAAYYLVHSMAAGAEVPELDRRRAETFGRAAHRAGVTRLVYLGGLGASPASAHLSSRHEVGTALGRAGVPVVELRAAVVFGAGSISFEMLRYLTERLPFMVCPRWVRTRIQPIALADLLDHLVRSLDPDVDARIYEIGGADVTTYEAMIAEYARIRGLRHRRIVHIPWLTPRLSSYWVDLVTPVDSAISHGLIESLVAEVVVTDPAPTAQAFGDHVRPMSMDDALAAALDDQDAAVTDEFFERTDGLLDGVHTVIVDVPVPPGGADAIARDLAGIGGSFGWYGAPGGWLLRVALGRLLLGERLRRRRPASLEAGAEVDWWRVVRAEERTLLLHSTGWKVGDAWLGYTVTDDTFRQAAAFRPKGVLGFLYWMALTPVHHVAFARMARRRTTLPRSRR